MTSPVRTEKLSKTYDVRACKGLFKSENRSVEALKSINLEINQGEVFGLLRPNGAGKTTLIKILTTLLLPPTGEAWINSFNVTQKENKVRASVGCMLMGERGLYLLMMTLSGTFGSGFSFAALTLRIKETAQTVANLLQFGLLMLCAIFFPSQHCPHSSCLFPV
jgi:ABC-type Na+ transport system ATPase subunit NatA